MLLKNFKIKSIVFLLILIGTIIAIPYGSTSAESFSPNPDDMREVMLVNLERLKNELMNRMGQPDYDREQNDRFIENVNEILNSNNTEIEKIVEEVSLLIGNNMEMFHKELRDFSMIMVANEAVSIAVSAITEVDDHLSDLFIRYIGMFDKVLDENYMSYSAIIARDISSRFVSSVYSCRRHDIITHDFLEIAGIASWIVSIIHNNLLQQRADTCTIHSLP